jgi:hypothetical protein
MPIGADGRRGRGLSVSGWAIDTGYPRRRWLQSAAAVAAAIISLRKIGERRAAQPLATRLGEATEDAQIVILAETLRKLGGKPRAGRRGPHRRQSESARAPNALLVAT